MVRDKDNGAVAPTTTTIDVNNQARDRTSIGSAGRRVLRLATFQRGYTFKQQSVSELFGADKDDIQVHKSRVSGCVKASYGAPQFAVLALYMLISVHATILYEYLGAPLSYLAFFTGKNSFVCLF